MVLTRKKIWEFMRKKKAQRKKGAGIAKEST